MFNALLSCPLLFRYSNLFWNESARKKFFFAKNDDFLTFGGCHGDVPWAIIRSMQNLSSSYIALPIRPVVHENSLFWGRPLKYKEKHPQNIYSPLGRHAGQAKLKHTVKKQKLLHVVLLTFTRHYSLSSGHECIFECEYSIFSYKFFSVLLMELHVQRLRKYATDSCV